MRLKTNSLISATKGAINRLKVLFDEHLSKRAVLLITASEKKIRNGASTALLIISILVLIVFILYLMETLGISAKVGAIINKIKTIYLSRKGEYLFFLGTTILSILLLRNSRWIGATLIFLAGVPWVDAGKSLIA